MNYRPFIQTEEEAVEPEDTGEIMTASEIETRALNSAAGNNTRYYGNGQKLLKFLPFFASIQKATQFNSFLNLFAIILLFLHLLLRRK